MLQKFAVATILGAEIARPGGGLVKASHRAVFKGSSSSPQEPSFNESAMALAVKSRRPRSLKIPAGWYSGRPGFGKVSMRAAEISART